MQQGVCKIRRGSRRTSMSKALVLIACTAVIVELTPGLQAQQQVSQADVQAVLQRCAQCHGTNLQMSKLNLSTREGMLKGGESGPSIIPGNAEASPLYRHIAGLQTPAMPMAPVPALNAQQIGLIKDWINQGAKWTDTVAPSSATSAKAYPGGYVPREITAQDRQWWSFKSRCATRRLRFAMPGGATIPLTHSSRVCASRKAWTRLRKLTGEL